MANLLSAEKISLALGTQQLLDSVSLGIGGGERIGVVGRNGGGKSTLLKVLAGVHEVDSGRLTMANGVTVGMLTPAPPCHPAIFVHLRDCHPHRRTTSPSANYVHI